VRSLKAGAALYTGAHDNMVALSRIADFPLRCRHRRRLLQLCPRKFGNGAERCRHAARPERAKKKEKKKEKVNYKEKNKEEKSEMI